MQINLMLQSGNVYKYLDQIQGGFWSCKKLLTYGRPWNFITGSRSVGKSTNIGAFFLLDFILNGHKFIYSRRTKDETLLTCQSFFGNPVKIINDNTDIHIHSLIYEGGEYFIQYEEDGEKIQCGCTIPLSLEQKYKSANFSEYCNFVLDEFICQDSTKYLGNKNTPDREYRAVLSLYQTIDRGINKPFRNETRFFFLGNTATIYNPLFLSVGISKYIDEKAKIIAPKGELWVLERIETVDALSEMRTSFAYLLSDEEGRDYAFKNRGADTDDYIKKPPANNKRYICTLVRNGCKYGVWADLSYTDYYIAEFKDVGREIISLDVNSHKENDLLLLTQWQDYPIIKTLLYKFKRNHLFYGNGKTKQEFYKYFNLMP